MTDENKLQQVSVSTQLLSEISAETGFKLTENEDASLMLMRLLERYRKERNARVYVTRVLEIVTKPDKGFEQVQAVFEQVQDSLKKISTFADNRKENQELLNSLKELLQVSFEPEEVQDGSDKECS